MEGIHRSQAIEFLLIISLYGRHSQKPSWLQEYLGALLFPALRRLRQQE